LAWILYNLTPKSFPFKKMLKEGVVEGVVPQRAAGLHVCYNLFSPICIPLKYLGNGGTQLFLLAQANKRRDGKVCCPIGDPLKVGGTPYHHMAIVLFLLLVLVEQVYPLGIDTLENLPAT
jgi:hypothetical protein